MNKLVFYLKNKTHFIAGGVAFMLGLAKHIASNTTEYDVYYVGYINNNIQELYGDSPLRLCDITSCDFAQFEGAEFFLPIAYITYFLDDAKLIKFGKLLTYDWHPQQIKWFANQFYDTSLSPKGVVDLLCKTNSLAYMDLSCLLSVSNYIEKPVERNLIPVFVSDFSSQCQDSFAIPQQQEVCRRVRIGWMSRLDRDKIFSLINLADNLYLMKCDVKIDVHIIGDGNSRNLLSLQKYSPKIRFIFTSYLTGKERDEYVKENIDIMVAMGISALDIAYLGVPVVIPVVQTPRFNGNQYVYLFDTWDYSLGWGQAELKDLGYESHTIEKIVQDIHFDKMKHGYGKRCYGFAKENFSVEHSYDCFVASLQRSTLTIDICRNNKILRRHMKLFNFYNKLRGQDYGRFVQFVQKASRFSRKSFSKKCSDLVIFAYRSTHGLARKVLRKSARTLVRVAKRNPVSQFLKKAIRYNQYVSVQKGYSKKIEHMKEYFDKEGKLKVAFLVVFSSAFPCEEVFKRMLDDNAFDPCIIVMPDVHSNRTLEHRINTVEKSMTELTQKYGKCVISGYDWPSNTYYELGEEYQIVFFSNPYSRMAHKFHFVNYFLDKNVLTVYENYGFVALKFCENIINTPFHSQTWRVCTESELNYSDLKKYQTIRGKNSIVTGYTKMDRLASVEQKKDNKKTVIICPHHTVMGWEKLNISNFLSYSAFFVELPKRYPDIEFIFRPHPLLFSNLVDKNIWTQAKVDEYIQKICSNSNLVYSTEGDYFELFANSDAMIHDCGSYTAEYLFTEKPCCYMLKSPSQIRDAFLPMGIECVEQHYKAYTEKDICNFLDDVIIKGSDPLRQSREKFSREKLKFNYPNSSDVIIREIKDVLSINYS